MDFSTKEAKKQALDELFILKSKFDELSTKYDILEVCTNYVHIYHESFVLLFPEVVPYIENGIEWYEKIVDGVVYRSNRRAE